MQRSIAVFITLAILTLPAAAFADTQQGAIETRIQALLLQISQITSQIKSLTNATTTPSTSNPAQEISTAVQEISNAANAATTSTASSVLCPALDRSLSYGLSGNDVLSLQHFLNSVGTLDNASLTGFFGVKTEAAVKSWQEEAGVVAADTAVASGWGIVGPKTRSAIEAACGGQLASPGTFGASLAISRTSNPLTASVQATTNIGNTCFAQAYSLNWGDESAAVPISIPAGKCAADIETFTHQYAAPGSYRISISSGSESTGANIDLDSAAPEVCAQPTFSFTQVPNGNVNSPYSLTLITDNGSSSLMLAATPLPAGLSLVEKQEAATTTSGMENVWALQGTPLIATSSDITISAHNDCGDAKVHFVLPVF